MTKVEDIINYFDTTEETFSEFTISDKIKQQVEHIDQNDIASFAELMAFEFVDTKNGNYNNWGTYYSPLWQGTKEDGTIVYSPSYIDISDEILKYWSTRALEAKHPILKSRYADLVWDFTKKITGKYSDIKFAHIVIEQNIILSTKRIYKHDIYVINKLKRALELSLSLGNNDKAIKVKNSILDYEDAISEDDKPGLWGFSFDLLLKGNKTLINEDEKAKIIISLENRIINLMNYTDNSKINPWAIQSAASRLAEYYKSQNKLDDTKRVLAKVEEAYSIKSENASPIQKMSWLEIVHDLYTHYGFKTESERIKIEIKKNGPEILTEMKEIGGEINLPKAEIENYINNIVQGELEEVFYRIAIEFIPNKDKTEVELKKLVKEYPLSYLMSRSVVDEKGRAITKIKPFHDDLEGNIIYKISKDLSISAIFLRYVFEKLETTSRLTVDTIQNYIFKSPFFEEDRRSILSKSIEAYIDKDFISFIHLIIPQIENAFRLLIEKTNGTVLKTSKSGGFQYKTFDELLREEAIEIIFGIDCALYFRILFTDQRGLNIRNNVCHGIVSSNTFNQSLVDHIFHSLLCICMIEEKSEN